MSRPALQRDRSEFSGSDSVFLSAKSKIVGRNQGFQFFRIQGRYIRYRDISKVLCFPGANMKSIVSALEREVALEYIFLGQKCDDVISSSLTSATAGSSSNAV